MATMHDIAQISGYSIGTVSRVINNRAGVSEKARKKIEAVIREQGFQPNSSARTLRQSMSSEVYIVVRGIANTFLQSLLEKTQIRIGRDEHARHGESGERLLEGVGVASQKDQSFGLYVPHDLCGYGNLVLCLFDELHARALATLADADLGLFEERQEEGVCDAAHDDVDL